ncbi:primary amine oxidase-like protein [Tanacetum coccineum]|uniref:Primary amine oxidase-like protein n=1 Tax=Tanacetum coccineum TaxID=301880 RepID=A0ABQ5AT29_9ASTR
MGLILFINIVNIAPTSPNKNGSEQVGDESVMKEITTSYANKLSPTSLTKANLWKLDAIVPNDVNYDVWLPLALVLEGVDSVLRDDSWMIHGVFIFLYKWSPSVSLLKKDLSCVPLWVKFHDVPLVVYTSDGLSLIATKIAFGRHLEEIHTLRTQFRKKGDKIATLLEDTQELEYSA